MKKTSKITKITIQNISNLTKVLTIEPTALEYKMEPNEEVDIQIEHIDDVYDIIGMKIDISDDQIIVYEPLKLITTIVRNGEEIDPSN